MTIINTFLQRKKLREHSNGIYMVFAAYVLSVLLLVIGSDAMYNIKSKANGIDTQPGEENHILNYSDNTDNLYQDYKVESRLEYHKKYLQGNQNSNQQILEQSVPVSDDTNWLLGLAMNDEEYNNVLLSIHDNELLKEEMEEKSIESFSVEDDNESKLLSVTDDEVTMLEKIVEAEAAGEDMVGKILVVNVILNRIEDDEFPDTIKDVIFQKVGDDYQFSPIADKRYWKVKVSKQTKEAVKRALSGEDYSQGALYFMSRKHAKKSNVKWFDKNLKWLFKHGTHEFYR